MNTIAGSKKDLGLFILVNLILGILYCFKIWNQIAILIIFGIFFPSIYTIALYRLFKIKNVPGVRSKIFSFAKTDVGNIVFLILDLTVLVSIGILILLDILNYTIVKLIVVIIIPWFYLITIHGLINDQFIIDKENKE
ncbi:hypothetical protein ACFLTE_01795 [Bacteroidota bacterium]